MSSFHHLGQTLKNNNNIIIITNTVIINVAKCNLGYVKIEPILVFADHAPLLDTWVFAKL